MFRLPSWSPPFTTSSCLPLSFLSMSTACATLQSAALSLTFVLLFMFLFFRSATSPRTQTCGPGRLSGRGTSSPASAALRPVALSFLCLPLSLPAFPSLTFPVTGRAVSWPGCLRRRSLGSGSLTSTPQGPRGEDCLLQLSSSLSFRRPACPVGR